MRHGCRTARSLFPSCAVALLVCASGCGVVSQRKFEDARLRVQALQAENEQLRDVVLNVRSQNRDMATRALEDARRQSALEEANRRLERSILAYQDENRQIAALLDQLRDQVRVAARESNTTTALLDQLDELDAAGIGRFDRGTMTVHLAPDRLFDPRSGAITAEADAWLDALTRVLVEYQGQADAAPVELVLTTTLPGDEIRRVSLRDDGESTAVERWRLHKIRERIEAGLSEPSSRIAVTVDNATAEARSVNIRILPDR